MTGPANAQTAPGVPTAVTATPGNGSVVLKWGPPASDGGSPIRSYSFGCGNGGANTNVSSWTFYVPNGTLVNCYVYANSAYGSSPRVTTSATPIGSPSAPSGLTVAQAAGQATLTWVAPSNNGGAAITGYKVTATPGAATCATTGALTCTIAGLSNGTLYSFAATSSNSLGTSGPSAAVTATMGVANTVPGAPTAVTAALLTSPVTLPAGSARISWTAPVNNGGSTITGYNLSSSPAGKTCAGGALGCDLSGLLAGTSYTFSVTATNTVGTSPAGTVSFVTPGVPGVATAVKATPGDGSIVLSWAPPASDGGTPVRSYSFGCGNSGANTNVSSWTYGGLVNGTAVNCYVHANNAMGGGVRTSVSATPMAATAPALSPTSPTPAGWTATVYQAADIAAGADGSVWFIGASSSINRVTATGPVVVGGAADRIALDPNGVAWVVNSNRNIFRWNGTGWQQMPGTATDVGAGGNKVWILDGVGTPAFWNGTGWTPVGGTAARISVDQNGIPWVVNAAGNIFRWNGTGWQVLSGMAKDIGIGADGAVYIVGTAAGTGGFQLHKWDAASSNWTPETGVFATAVAAGPAGRAYAARGLTGNPVISK